MNRRGSDSNHRHNYHHSEEPGQCRLDSNWLEPSVSQKNNERGEKRERTANKIKANYESIINFDN